MSLRLYHRKLERLHDRGGGGRLGDGVDVEYVWNIMDHGHKAEDILNLVENGEMTLGYQSSSYLTDRVPELGFVDLPFLFANNRQARAAMDGALGAFLVRKTEERRLLIVLNFVANPRTFNMADLRSRGRVMLSTHLDRHQEAVLDDLTLRADEGVIVELL